VSFAKYLPNTGSQRNLGSRSEKGNSGTSSGAGAKSRVATEDRGWSGGGSYDCPKGESSGSIAGDREGVATYEEDGMGELFT